MSFLDEFVEWSNRGIFDSEVAINYISSRGVSIDQVRSHSIGYASSRFHVNKEFCICDNRSCDVCRFSYWNIKNFSDDNSGRIIFPITTYTGKIVGVQTRSITEKSYNSFYVNRRPESHFFGLSRSINDIWYRQAIILTEGPFDQLIMERLVSPMAVSVLTSEISPSHAIFIRRFVKTIFSCFDNDRAGVNGFWSLFNKNSSDVFIRKLRFPNLKKGDKDLSDFWKHSGDVKFRRHFLEQIEPWINTNLLVVTKKQNQYRSQSCLMILTLVSKLLMN